MSEARNAVLARLRQALGRADGAAADARAAVQRRLAQHPAGPIPARSRLDSEGRIGLFMGQIEAVAGEVRRVSGLAAVPQAVTHWLRARNLPLSLVMASDPWLAGAPFAAEKLLTIRQGAPQDADMVGLTRAVAGVAETGTLVLLSGKGTPTTLAFMPESCIVVLPAARVVGAYEEALPLLRALPGGLPRSVNLITGPSRTGDIEQTLQLGAHGPKRLLVVLVDGPPG